MATGIRQSGKSRNNIRRRIGECFRYQGEIGGIEVYLYVAFDDTWGAWNDVNMGFSGCGTSYRRIKKIKMTEEQIKQLQPRQVGESGGKPLYENVSVLCIQEE